MEIKPKPIKPDEATNPLIELSLIEPMTRKKRQCVLYARFSPRPDADQCESCESQLADLRAWCKKRGFEIVGEYHDNALSGSDEWDDREGMFDAVHATKKDMYFLVRSYDRLFRDTTKGMMFVSMIEKKGAEVRSITEESANGDEMTAKLIRFVFLWVADYQRQVTKARTRAKMLQHQANGRRMSGECPYGMRTVEHDTRRMEKDVNEFCVIDIIKQAYKEGDSLRAIARLLNEYYKIPNRKGKPWHHYQVRRILKREGVLYEQRDGENTA